MTRQDLPDEELMDRFGAALKAEVDGVEPSSGSLARIQARVAGHDDHRRTVRWLAPLAAAAAVVAIASAALLLPHGDRTASPPVVQPSSSFSPSLSASPSSSPSPSLSSSDPSACTTAVAAYYVADLPAGPRLYREFIRTDGSCFGGQINAALTTMFQVAPTDPDYTSLWPVGTQVLSVERQADTVTVDVSAFPAVGAGLETAAVQQLVWTATAADPSVKRVRLLVDGEVPPSGHIDWSKPVARANSLETLANVWILDPTQGQEVNSPVTVHVYGTGYEGNVPLKVFQDGVEVASTFVTTEMGAFREAKTTIDLPPGTYELRAYNDNGKGATLMLWDTKTFTVG